MSLEDEDAVWTHLNEALELGLDPRLVREALTRFASMMAGSEGEDLVQEAVSVALKKRETFEGRSKFSTWLYAITLNLCRKHLRNQTRHATPTDREILEEQKASSRGVLSSVIRHEMAEQIEQAVDRLPLSMREVFLLHYMEGMGFAEIALVAEVSEGTARVRASRARALLRSELGSVVDTVWIENRDS